MQSELERQNTEQVFARTQQYEDVFDRALSDGTPLPSRDDIVFDPALDALSRERLLQRHESTIQELENYAWFKAKFDDVKAGSFERADPDTRKFIDRVYKSRGGDAAALYSVVSRTGIMPESAVSTMSGDLASGDFARAGRTVEQLVLLAKDHPNLLAADQRSADLQNAVTQYQYEKGRGSTSEKAIKQIIQPLSPEYQKALELKNKGVDAAKAIDNVTSLFDLDESFAGDPASMAIMYMTYRNVAQERLRATGEPALAKAQALDLIKPIAEFGNSDADNAKRNDTPSVDGWVPTLAERAWYNALASFYLGTSLGAAQLNLVAKERRMVEARAKDDELLGEFHPALLENRPDQKGHREAALRSLRSAPQRHMDILADLARYNAMKGYSSMAEAAVALIGQVGGSLPTPETLAGSLGKGVTWGARFLSGAWRQGAVNAVVNPAVQALSIAGGGQERYDPWQHAMSVGVGSIVGGAGSALFGRRLVPAAFDGSTSAPHAPETLPSGMKLEEAPFAPKSEAQVAVSAETAAPSLEPGGKESVQATVDSSDALVPIYKRVVANSHDLEGLVQKGASGNLSLEETVAIRLFTTEIESTSGQPVYSWLNSALQKGAVDENASAVAALLDGALSKRVVDEATIYRGVRADQGRLDNIRDIMNSGGVMTVKEFQSFSIDREVATGFSKPGSIDGESVKGLVFVIKKNKKAPSIQDLSSFPSEAERLHPSNSKFRVLKVERTTDRYIEVELEQIID